MLGFGLLAAMPLVAQDQGQMSAEQQKDWFVGFVEGQLSTPERQIRISNIDTPETFRPRCERELVLGLKAKERLRALLDAGPVTFTPSGKDVLQLSAGACATGAGLGTGCDDHHRRRHDRHRADPVV